MSPPDVPFFFGGDIGLISDSSALAGVELVEGRVVLRDLVELRPSKGEPLKLSSVIATFASVVKARKASAFMADGWSREPAREYTNKESIELVTAPEGQAGKATTYLAMRDALRERVLDLAIPEHPALMARLRTQLRGIISKPVPGGALRIMSPRRAGHGDLVSALVLAVYQAQQARRSAAGDDYQSSLITGSRDREDPGFVTYDRYGFR